MFTHPKRPLGHLLVAMVLWLSGCGGMSERFGAENLEGRLSDRIMLVRRDPETLGYRRLAQKSGSSEELVSFLRLRGYPDFLAETRNEGRHYMVFYYLADSQAYASRSMRGSAQQVSFAGPYEITKSEVELLKKVVAISGAQSAPVGMFRE